MCLRSLQQTTLKPTMRADILASLVVLPRNDEFWRLLAYSLHGQASTWTVPAAGGVAWVIIAYLLSVAVSFLQMPDLEAISDGQGVGSAWTSLIAIITGWLIVSPKSNARRNADCIERANQVAWIAPYSSTASDHLIMSRRRHARAMEVLEDDPHVDLSLFRDQVCSQPIYNYARFHSWREFVLKIHSYYNNANSRAQASIPVRGEYFRKHVPSSIFDPNRVGIVEEVIAYCSNYRYENASVRSPGKVQDFILACLAAATLQWCTIGAAVITALYTPTTGLGCRSLGYIIFGVISDITWGLFLLSSWLCHIAVMNIPVNAGDSSPINGRIPFVAPSAESVGSHPHTPHRLNLGIPSVQAAKHRFLNTSELPESFEMAPLVSPLSSSGVTVAADIGMDLISRGFSRKRYHSQGTRPYASARFFSILFRRLGKIFGSLNSFYFVALCLTQISGGFDTCFCASNAFSRGLDGAYIVMKLTSDTEIRTMYSGFIASVVLSVGCTVTFIVFVWVLMTPTNTFPRTTSSRINPIL
ncbi:hypothetical protein DL96DRAFT_272209 [Flagelloscypha sp. PMI_526]|nr:hypothetical protein DL96DRAFT_272209 [Flagelloscypha sp. PMI_526]